MIGYVLYSERDGVFIGHGLGLGFWSKLDPVGQNCAVTFKSEEDALNAAPLFHAHTDVRAVPVVVDQPAPDMAGVPAHYVSIAACVAAGLPAWNPDE